MEQIPITPQQAKYEKNKRIARIVGLAVAGISLGAFLIPELKPELRARDPFESSVFFINYVLAIGFFLGINILNFTQNQWKFWKLDQKLYQISLFLFSVSAFSLNHSITVFSGFPDWLMIYLIFVYGALLLQGVVEKGPVLLQHLIYFLLGAGVAMTLYFTIVLLPAMVIGVIGAVILGLSLHLLAPAFALAEFIRVGLQKRKTSYFWTWLSGAILPVLFVGVFTVKWIGVKTSIDEIKTNYYASGEEQLPLWAVYGQQVPDGIFTDWILKSEVLYQIRNRDLFWGLENSWEARQKKHDPLFVIANFIGGDLPLSALDAEKTVESRVSLKHASQRRLWSGQNLETSFVETKTQVFPDYRIAYTEKKLVIHNNLPDVSEEIWQNGRQQEAVYTFHLPEGSVATSLSLWINGIEEKSRLTSKTKADSAYTTIVGRERRDPSLIHWQEGNTLVVTVFPCTPQEDRIFKIGITTPLHAQNERLLLENIYFEGPTIRNAKEKTEIFFEGETATGFMPPRKMEETEAGKWAYEGNYKPWWEFAFDAPALSARTFSFNGQVYTAKAYEPQLAETRFQNLYLAIDESWSAEDLDAIWASRGNRKVFVYDHKIVEVTEANREELFAQNRQYRYSLFPIYQIPNPAQSLLITGSSEYAPELHDLKEDAFGIRLNEWATELEHPLPVYHLGGELPPYLKSLKEFRLLNYARGEVDYLQNLLANDRFPRNVEGEDRVVLHHAQMMIEKDQLSETGGGPAAPDHLARLFAYNDIMRRVGKTYLTDEYITDPVLNIAKEAYVVSPVSSMIVLETQEDYERFGIEENTNSLGNASQADAGQVPEPHEWALILLFLVVVSVIYRKKVLAVWSRLRKA